MIRLITSALLALIPSISLAHDWYPYECCSNKDCKPIDAQSIQATQSGYFIQQNGETLPYTDRRVRISPDGKYHLCTVGGTTTGETLCLFTPAQGS